LSVFDDPNLLNKSVEYAINPPLVVMTNNKQAVNKNTAGHNQSSNQPSFKEIAKFKMNNLQKETMKILVEDDNKIEKLRGGKISITIDEPSMLEKTSNKNKDLKNQNRHSIRNGPIDFSKFNLKSNAFSFMELRAGSQLQSGQSKYTQPISVLMKLPSEPDPKLKKEIGNMEKKRENFESKIFKKAKEEFKLITALTKKELQIELNHELLPFFVVSKNGIQGINNIIQATFPSQNKKSASFLQIDNDEVKNKFPHLNLSDPINLNKQVYSGILNFFLSESSSARIVNRLNQPPSHQESDKPEINREKDILASQVDFSYQRCLELAKGLKNYNCNELKKDYNQINDYLHSSFLEMMQKGNDFLNVKFAASDEPYPTIEKLVAQMMTRRDLAEKFERLKILEYESHLQKAENEMIQDILHDHLYKIMSTYGPSIEGMKEHIH
jgi:hypothetical protein